MVVQGPVVGEVDDAFRAAWRRSGGDDFEIQKTEPGSIDLRMVVHEGLRDAETLEAYRWIFDEAEDHIYVVNTFPLQFELQTALLRAIERGVKVSYLVGNPRPRFGEDGTFSGWAMRELPSQLVFGRLDPLVEAGARVVELGLPNDALEIIYPHVHAKLAISDGSRLLIGSPNVDISSSYWESEAALLVEDARAATELEQQLEQLFSTSRPLQKAETGRQWIARLWPSIIG